MPSTRATAELQVFNPVLTNIARRYRPAGRLYGDVTVNQPVDKISDQYIIWDERYFFSNADDNSVTDRAPAPEIDLTWSTDSFTCKDYALKIGITPREQQQARRMGALDRLRETKVTELMDQMANRREKRLAALLRKTTNGGGLNLGAAATTAFATSTAIEADWETAKTAVYNKTGLLPNVAIIPYAKAVDMANNSTLRDILKYFVNSSGFISLEQGAVPGSGGMILPREFHGTRIVIPFGALAQTGHEGAAKSLSDVWGTSVRFLYLPEGQGSAQLGGDDDRMFKPATGYTFSHPVLSSDATAAAGSGPVVTTFQTVDPVIEYVKAEECFAEKVCAPDTGYELTGV